MPTIADLFEYRHPNVMVPIQHWMEQRGLQFINSGALAAAFRNKSGEVVKVFHDDPCYQTFVGLASKHADNPHFPRLRKLTAFNHPNLQGVFMLKMEPLQPLPVREWLNNMGLHCYIIVEHNMLNLGNKKLYVENLPMAYIIEMLHGDPKRDSAALAKARQWATTFKRDQPEFATAIDLVMSHKAPQCHIDLHSGNFMKRGSTWVIIDPYIG